MARGRLESPNLDDRTWRQLVDEARALIPRYAPEWTDHNPSDLGIALIELFAWIVESMIYRLNQVPEKNFIEFLNLLGITRDPATPASTYLTYQLAPDSNGLLLPKGSQAATSQTETETALIFETDQDAELLPINLTTALGMPAAFIGQTVSTPVESNYKNVTTALVSSPLTGTTIAIPAAESVTLMLGFDRASTLPLRLLWSFSKPVAANEVRLTWRYSSAPEQLPTTWELLPTTVDDGTKGLQKNGVVALTVPQTWTAQSPPDWTGIPVATPGDQIEEALFWLGLEIENITDEPTNGQQSNPRTIEIGLAHTLFNSVSATHALSVTQDEPLGVSNGEPFQVFELQHRPLYKRSQTADPYDHLLIQVREPQVGGGFGPWTAWTRVEDFPKGAGRFYRLDPVTGSIYFGNFDPITAQEGNGTIPPPGSEIRAGVKPQAGSDAQVAGYRYVVGGVQGNVPPNRIQVIRSPLPGIQTVTNLGPATGGVNEEAVEETKRRAPELLKNRDRAITTEDYEYLAREASTEIEKVRCLPPRLFTQDDDLPDEVVKGDPWTFGGLNRSTGSVNLIIIPAAPLSNARPLPSEQLLQEVFAYLSRRCPVASQLHVTDPRYLPIDVAVDINIWQSAIRNDLTSREQLAVEVRQKIEQFLHPLLGGPAGSGWDIGQEIAIADLFDVLRPPSDIGFISRLEIAAGSPVYQPGDRPYPTGVLGIWLPIADYEIICSGTHQIEVTQLGN